jgi:O-acetyl-ADP-ribose deacetylase (regulator of RNase III)
LTSRRFGSVRLELARGDITHERVDAIVNAANSGLLGGGGVDGAIHRAGGPAILEECRRIRDERGPLPAGEAVITGAGRLPSRYVIHTVGPVWRGGHEGEAERLASCHTRSLELAAEHELRSLAFPAISTGVYGYPPARAARVALETLSRALGGGAPLDLVRIVLFSSDDLEVWTRALEELALDDPGAV